MRPVAKAMKKQMPSHAPTRAATRGWCSRDGKSRCSGIGGDLSAVMPAPPPARRPSGRRRRASRAAKPAAVATEGIASAPTTDHGNGSEVSPPALSRTLPECRPVPGGARSATTRPPGASSWAMRRSRRTGSPPMPRLPSASSTVSHRPSAGTRSKTLRRIAETPRSRVCQIASGTTSIPSTISPRSASSWVIRPGPQPTSSVGPAQRSSTAASPSRVPVHASAGTSSRVTSGPAITHGWPRKTLANTASTEASTSDTDPPPEPGEGRVGGAHGGDGLGVVGDVDVAQHRAAADGEAGDLERRAGRRPPWSAWTSGRRPGARHGVGRPAPAPTSHRPRHRPARRRGRRARRSPRSGRPR